MKHISLFDIHDWIEELKKRKIKEFQYKDLPEDLQKRTFLQKAAGTGMIIDIGNKNGRNIWRITERARPK